MGGAIGVISSPSGSYDGDLIGTLTFHAKLAYLVWKEAGNCGFRVQGTLPSMLQFLMEMVVFIVPILLALTVVRWIWLIVAAHLLIVACLNFFRAGASVLVFE